ncbi:MAG: hybrid sensor histidine kinase/response regulator [Burkholderiales bacterium]
MNTTLPDTGSARSLHRSGGSEPDGRVFAEQVRLLYRELPVATSGTTLAAVVIAAAMWGRVPAVWLGGWLAVVLANLWWRVMVLLRFRAQAGRLVEFDYWARMWLLGATISGALFGVAGVLFFDAQSLFHQVLLMGILFAMASGTVPTLATYQPSLYLFLIPAIVPLAVRLTIEGGPHTLIGIVLIVVVAMMIMLGRYYSRALGRSLAIRFANLDLIDALSAEKRAAEEARSEAEIANRSKTQFFAAASHDLRQPLHAMGLFASALVEKVRDPEVINVVHSINASVEALEALFNELLDISKIDAGVVQPNPSHFAVQALFDRIKTDLEPEAQEKNLRLRFVPTGRAILSDPILVERIIRNLVSNAIRYTRRGGIVVGCRARMGRLWIEVWDSGVGISSAEQEKVFEEFYQIGNSERDRRKGLGLGLSIVKRLAHLLDSELRLDSRTDRGSVFRVSFLPGTAPALSTGAVATTIAPAGLDGALIAVIDDEASVLEGMRVLLSGWGARVIGAGSLNEAKAILDTDSDAPHLIVADYRLREGENGLDAITALREHFGMSIPGILVTGNTSPDLSAHAKRDGVHILSKPVMPGKLRTLINFKLKEGRKA